MALTVDGQPVLQRRAQLANPDIRVYDIGEKFHSDHESGKERVILEHAQEIPQSFVSMLRQMKADSMAQREREFMHVASIPAIFWHKYLREGFDIMKEPVRETCKRLIRDGLDSFVVTNKRV